jgi:hypothetical protein
MWDQSNPPPPGTLVAVSLIFISRSCGTPLVGYAADSDETYLYLARTPDGGRDGRIGWNGVVSIEPATDPNAICIDI